MAEKKVIQMTFGLENGKEHIVSLLNPKASLNAEAVRPVMQSVVTHQAIKFGGSPVATIKKAVIVATNTQTIL